MQHMQHAELLCSTCLSITGNHKVPHGAACE